MKPGESLISPQNVTVTPGYFEAMGARIVRGRAFDDRDGPGAPNVIIVDEKLARRFWPGPLTVIVKAASRLPLKVTANTGNVALRVPAAEIPLAVVRAAGLPVTATSANLSGASECTTAVQVRDQLQDRIGIIVDGGTSPREVASTIVDLTDDEARWRVIREGAIPSQTISEYFAQG